LKFDTNISCMKTMKAIKPSLAHTICYYSPLLERYARRLINNEAVARVLVTEVLEDQYEIDKLAPSDHLRQVLKSDLGNRCLYFKLSQIFDRPLIKITLNSKFATDNNY